MSKYEQMKFRSRQKWKTKLQNKSNIVGDEFSNNYKYVRNKKKLEYKKIALGNFYGIFSIKIEKVIIKKYSER